MTNNKSLNQTMRMVQISIVAVKHFFRSPANTFIFLASLFGLLFIALMPPFTGLDEEAHFVRAYGITKGDIRLVDTNLVDMPVSYRQTIGCFQYKKPHAGEVYIYNYEQYGVNKAAAFKCASNIQLNSGGTEPVRTSASFYSPSTYLPQIIAIFFGRLFDLPIIAISYLVRLSVLIAYIILITVAIKLIPIRKWALVGVALLPHSIVQITNPGGDYMLLGLAALLVAVVVRSMYLPDKQFFKEDLALTTSLVLVSILVMLPKGIFPGVCLLPLVFFSGGVRHGWLKKMGIITLALAIGIAWQRIGAPAVLGQSLQPTSNSIMGLPVEFIKTMYYRWADADFLHIGDPVGTFQRLGVHAGTPSITVTLVNMLFAAYVFIEYPEVIIRKPRTRIQLLGIVGVMCVIGVVLGSFAALYLASSDLQDGTGVIRGVQSRYFYPAFIVVACLPFARYLRTKIDVYSKIVVVGTTVVLSSYVVKLLFEFQWGIF